MPTEAELVVVFCFPLWKTTTKVDTMKDRDVTKSQKQRKKRSMSRRRDVIVKLKNEHEVVQKAKSGCRDSMEVLYVQYLPFLKNAADRVARNRNRVDFDDAIQQAAIHFMNAVRTYETGHGTGFSYWVVKCVSLQMIRFCGSYRLIKLPERDLHGEFLEAAKKTFRIGLLSDVPEGGASFEEDDGYCPRTPIDQSAVQPFDAAVNSEEKEILEEAICKLEPLDRILVRGRLQGKFYEDCGKDVCRKLGMNISTHRESVRQRASRSFLRLQDRIYEVIGERRMQVSQNSN